MHFGKLNQGQHISCSAFVGLSGIPPTNGDADIGAIERRAEQMAMTVSNERSGV